MLEIFTFWEMLCLWKEETIILPLYRKATDRAVFYLTSCGKNENLLNRTDLFRSV